MTWLTHIKIHKCITIKVSGVYIISQYNSSSQLVKIKNRNKNSSK
jgi:hypothetical protein